MMAKVTAARPFPGGCEYDLAMLAYGSPTARVTVGGGKASIEWRLAPYSGKGGPAVVDAMDVPVPDGCGEDGVEEWGARLVERLTRDWDDSVWDDDEADYVLATIAAELPGAESMGLFECVSEYSRILGWDWRPRAAAWQAFMERTGRDYGIGKAR